MMDFSGFNRQLPGSMASTIPGMQPQAKPQPGTRNRGGTPTSLISEGGALGGAALGASIGSIVPGIGTVIGGAIGAGVGAFGGRLAENKVRDDRWGVKDAAMEGAMSGVLSAPGKLVKGGITGAKALKGGGSLEDALTATKGAINDPGRISKFVGNKASNAADNLATHALKINDSKFLTDFANRTGEEVGQFATRHGIVGMSKDDILNKVYAPAQQIYKDRIKQLGTVSKAQVQAALDRQLGTAAKSAFPEDQAFASQVRTYVDGLLSKYGDAIPAEELNRLKSAAFKKVDSKLSDSAGKISNDKFETIARTFRTAVGDAAEAKGIRITPDELKGMGLNYNAGNVADFGDELFAINELAKKIDVKSRVGKGRLPAGLTKTTSVAAGGSVAGIPGAVAGFAAAELANNPKVLTAVTRGLDRFGHSAAGKAPTAISGAAQGIGRGMMGAGAATLGETLLNNQSDNNVVNSIMPTNTGMDSMAKPISNIDTSYQTMDKLSSTTGSAPRSLEASLASPSPYSRENLLADIQRDPANTAKYIQYYQELDAIFNPVGAADTGLKSNVADRVSSVSNADFTVGQLEDLFTSAGGGSGRIGGFLGNQMARAGLNDPADSYNALADSSVVQLAKAINGGGQVSDADAAALVKALPRINDNPAVARDKFEKLRARLQIAKQNALVYGGNIQPEEQLGVY